MLVLLAGVATMPTRGDEAKEHAAVKPVPRDANWMKRHEKFNEIAKKGEAELVFFGDSITQGWEGGGAKKVWEKHYGNRKAANFGIGGDRTQHLLWRIDNGNFDGIKPKLVVLMIGTNNSNSDKPEMIADGVKAILDRLAKKVPDTKVLVLGIFPRGKDNDDRLRKVNAAATEIFKKAADDKRVFFLDIGAKFLKEDGTLEKEIMPDLLHLSGKGYEIWAESIEAKVKELLGEK